MKEVDKPKDWNDHSGWENYYAYLHESGEYLGECKWTGSISIDRIGEFVEGLRQSQMETIWIPGCGVSLLPRLLQKAGLKVFATDVSQSAIDFQRHDDSSVDKILSNIKMKSDVNVSLVSEVHDFREPYRDNFFDFILNVKAFQGFPPDTKRQLAKVHFESLKPSRSAMFDTINVQGERRDELEECLVHAGFLIAFYELDRWYRKQLAQTGIPYVFILGRPMIPFVGEYEHDELRRQRDTEILQEIEKEYQARRAAGFEEEQQRLNQSTDARYASLIYSTG